jgi:hypothetical protein
VAELATNSGGGRKKNLTSKLKMQIILYIKKLSCIKHYALRVDHLHT